MLFPHPPKCDSNSYCIDPQQCWYNRKSHHRPHNKLLVLYFIFFVVLWFNFSFIHIKHILNCRLSNSKWFFHRKICITLYEVDWNISTRVSGAPWGNPRRSSACKTYGVEISGSLFAGFCRLNRCAQIFSVLAFGFVDQKMANFIRFQPQISPL